MTAREKVLAAARKRGLTIYEDGRRVSFGYFQVSFKDNGNWRPECAHGPRLGTGRRATLKLMLAILEVAEDKVLGPPHTFEQAS